MLDWVKKMFIGEEARIPAPERPEAFDMPSQSIQLKSLAHFSEFSNPKLVRDELKQSERRLALIEQEPPEFQDALNHLIDQKRFKFVWDSDRDPEFREVFSNRLRSNCFISREDGPQDWDEFLSDPQFSAFLDDLEKRAEFFTEVSGAQEISMRVAVLDLGVHEDNLPFHIDSTAHLDGTDYLKIKSLSTYGGFGCEWFDDENLKPGVQQILHAVSSMSPEALLIDTDQIYTSPVFANLLLKLGEEGLVHRTPKVSGKRIRVQIDVIP